MSNNEKDSTVALGYLIQWASYRDNVFIEKDGWSLHLSRAHVYNYLDGYVSSLVHSNTKHFPGSSAFEHYSRPKLIDLDSSLVVITPWAFKLLNNLYKREARKDSTFMDSPFGLRFWGPKAFNLFIIENI